MTISLALLDDKELTPEKEIELGKFILKVAQAKTVEDTYRVLESYINILIHCDRSILTLLNSSSNAFESSSSHGRGGFISVSKTSCFSENFVIERSAKIKTNFGQDSLAVKGLTLYQDDLKSFMSAPLIIKDTVVGFISCGSSHSEFFSQESLQLLELMSSIVSENVDRLQSKKSAFFHANFDSLTGLPNWQSFNRTAQRMIAQASNAPFALLLVDIDSFSKINDIMGHAVGDDLLKMAVERITKTVSSDSKVARVCGDHFAVLLLMNDADKYAIDSTNKILQSISKPFKINGNSIHISACIGVCLAPQHTDSYLDLIKFADIALHVAKSRGRNNYQCYQPEQSSILIRKQNIRNALRTAVSNKELYLNFQPQFCRNHLVGAEVLLRWNHPDMGEISPEEFIPVAEEGGVIQDITEWVLDNALSALSEFRRIHNSLYIAVNISGRDCHNRASLIKKVKSSLVSHNLPGNALELEITENIYLEDLEAVSELLIELKDLGVKIAIDDFGTGYSSLTHLLNLPLDTLKIDKSFINDIQGSQMKLGVVKGILAIANSLNMRCVAEGVELVEQFNKLKELDCHCFQGYLFSRPVSKKQFIDMCSNGYITTPSIIEREMLA